jgi:adenine-specific DNA-methyltransferase
MPKTRGSAVSFSAPVRKPQKKSRRKTFAATSAPNASAASSRVTAASRALGGEFAYLQLDKVEVPDLPFEADAAHAFQLLALRRFGEARPLPAGPVKRLGQSGDCAVLLCERVDAETIASLVDWRAQNGVARLAIYSPRPSTLAEQLAAAGIEANCYSLLDAVMRGQVGGGANE